MWSPPDERGPVQANQSATTRLKGDHQKLAPTRTFGRHALILQNASPHPLVIHGDGVTVKLAPLERTTVSPEIAGAFDRELLRTDSRLVVREEREQELAHAIGCVPWVLIALVIVGLIVDQAYFWVGVALVGALTVTLAFVAARRGVEDAGRTLRQVTSFVFVLFFAAGLPATVTLLQGIDWDTVQLLSALRDRALSADDRFLGWLFFSLLSLLPALLFYVFDRMRLSQLRQDYLRHVFRLDRDLGDVASLRGKYGRSVEDSFGSVGAGGSGTLLPGSRLPLVVATAVVALGWTLIARPTSRGTGLDLAVSIGERSDHGLMAYAFIGAYLFSLVTLSVGFGRRDLQARSYGRVTVQLVVAVVLAGALGLGGQLSNEHLGLAGLVIGIVPYDVLRGLPERARALLQLARSESPPLLAGRKLRELEGLSPFDESRLHGQGVDSVEALAASDLVQLLMDTRIPAGQLIDWMDQAILWVATRDVELRSGKLADMLAAAGIRRATQLAKAHEEPERIRKALGEPDERDAARVELTRQTIEEAAWTKRIAAWRRDDSRQPVEVAGWRATASSEPSRSQPKGGEPANAVGTRA